MLPIRAQFAKAAGIGLAWAVAASTTASCHILFLNDPGLVKTSSKSQLYRIRIPMPNFRGGMERRGCASDL